MNSSINKISAGRELLYQAFQANPDVVIKAAVDAYKAYYNVGQIYHSYFYMSYKNNDLDSARLRTIAINRRNQMQKAVAKVFSDTLTVNSNNENASMIQAFVAYKLGTEEDAIRNLNLCAPIDRRNSPSLTKFLEKLSQGKFASEAQKQEKKANKAKEEGNQHNAAIDRKIENFRGQLQDLLTCLVTLGENVCKPLSVSQKLAAKDFYDKAQSHGLSSISQELLEEFRRVCGLDGKQLSAAAAVKIEFPYSVYANWNHRMDINIFENLLAAAGFVKIPKGDYHTYALNSSNAHVKYLQQEIVRVEDQITELQEQKIGG